MAGGDCGLLTAGQQVSFDDGEEVRASFMRKYVSGSDSW